jgi:hypothetical protein
MNIGVSVKGEYAFALTRPAVFMGPGLRRDDSYFSIISATISKERRRAS